MEKIHLTSDRPRLEDLSKDNPIQEAPPPMKTEEAKFIITLIRDSSVGDILIVSFVILPILLVAWSFVLDLIKSPMKLNSLGVLVLLYVVSVVVMKYSESKKDQRARAAKHIRNRLERRSNHLGSFDYIRRTVNSGYTDGFLTAILDEFSDDFRRAQIKGGKPGIALKEPSEDPYL